MQKIKQPEEVGVEGRETGVGEGNSDLRFCWRKLQVW